MANSVFISLGGNLGNTREIFKNVYVEIEKKVGPITKKSSIYQTAAWGPIPQPDFLNQVIKVATHLAAAETLALILSIEKNMGRIRTTKNAPRIIDIDILFFNNEIINQSDLIVPHPEIQNRRFVLTPLQEIAPQMIHPVLNKTIDQLLSQCPDQLAVKKNIIPE